MDLGSDAYCRERHGEAGLLPPDAPRIDQDGGLRDVFVQVLDPPEEGRGDGPRPPRPDAPDVLVMEGCRLDPFVMGLQAPGMLVVQSADPVLHTLEVGAVANPDRSLALPRMGEPHELAFTKPEDAIPLGCDVHAWERAHVFVLDHPYFAVTDAAGRFAIDARGLPDGLYTVRLWHAAFGSVDVKAELAGGQGALAHVW